MSVGKKIGNFVLEKELGRGSFGSVFSCRDTTDNSLHAIKIIEYQSLSNSDGIVGELLKDEIKVLSLIDSPNVIRLEHYFQSKQNCYIVMEYCDSGDLEKYWEKKGKMLPENEVIDIIRQLLNGLNELHKHNVIHRDLKLANILIHQNCIKLADLGFCTRLQNKDQQVNLCLGSPGTMAPEVAKFTSYGLQSDIFSIGCIFYQLLFGDLPFEYNDSGIYLSLIHQQKINFQKNGVRVSKEVEHVIRQMVKESPDERMTFPQLYKTQYFKQPSMIKSQASKIALQKFEDNSASKFYEQMYDEKKEVQFNQQNLDAIKTQIDVFKTQGKDRNPDEIDIFPQSLQQSQNNQQLQKIDEVKNKNLNQFNLQIMAQNLVKPIDLSTSTQKQDSQEIKPLYQQNLQQNNIQTESQIELKIKQYDNTLNAIYYHIRMSELIEYSLQNFQEGNIIFYKFMIYKLINVKCNDTLNDLKNNIQKSPIFQKYQEYQSKFNDLKQTQQFNYYLQLILDNPKIVNYLQPYQQQELQEAAQQNFIIIYYQTIKEFHRSIKPIFNKLNDNKIKKELLILLNLLQQCTNFDEIQNSGLNFDQEYEKLKKIGMIDLMKKVKLQKT